MKKIGSVAEFGHKRDSELLKAFRRAVVESETTDTDEFYRLAAASPSTRFWVSERRASEVIGQMLKGRSIEKMTPMRQKMYRELYRRALLYIEEHPGCTIYDAAFAAVNTPAPEFYLTPLSCRVILSRARRRSRPAPSARPGSPAGR